MRSRFASFVSALTMAALLALAPAPVVAQVPTPEQFFGFQMGTAGELARYP